MIASQLSEEMFDAVAGDGCQYLVNHGKSGGLGCFAASEPLALKRGDRVVLRTRRGLELGTVLCQASVRQARLLQEASGELLRRATTADEQTADRLDHLGQQIFQEGRRLAVDANLPLEILDVELLLDGRQAILQHLSVTECDYTPLVEALSRRHDLQVFLENLAAPAPVEEEAHGGCGKPDCGKTAGGSCTTCGTGGGCSSCASGSGVDMRAYFAHLRGKMEEAHQRRPLL
jgi:hypothetical protein